jgi:hypothetical protein
LWTLNIRSVVDSAILKRDHWAKRANEKVRPSQAITGERMTTTGYSSRTVLVVRVHIRQQMKVPAGILKNGRVF